MSEIVMDKLINLFFIKNKAIFSGLQAKLGIRRVGDVRICE